MEFTFDEHTDIENMEDLPQESADELDDLLKDNILERYHNSEYWDDDIIDNFLADMKTTKSAHINKEEKADSEDEDLDEEDEEELTKMRLHPGGWCSASASVSICPQCKQGYSEHPAISRRDNKTRICSECGVREAMKEWSDWLVGNEEK